MQSGKEVDVKNLANRVRHIFEKAGQGGEAAAKVAAALEELEETGASYCEAGQWQPAAGFYQGMVAGICEAYEHIDDTEDAVLMVLDAAIKSLFLCLENAEEAPLRSQILEVLVEVYLWDVMMGGIGIGQEVQDLVAREVREAEQPRVVQKLRQGLPEGNPEEDDFSREWNRKQIESFLLLLEGELYDDETFLEHCRATGRRLELINRLLVLGRVDEAVAESQHLKTNDFFEVLDVFEQQGHLDSVLDLIRTQIEKTKDRRLVEALKRTLEEKGEIQEARQWSEWLFWRQKSLKGYDDLKRLAVQCGVWDTRSKAVEARLREIEAYELLTEIFLREGEYNEAIEFLNRLLASSRPGWDAIPHCELINSVISAIEGIYPEEAIRLHGYMAEAYIGLRGRAHYRFASRHMARLLDVYESLGRSADGLMVIDDMKAIHSNLRVFLEEMKKAGL